MDSEETSGNPGRRPRRDGRRDRNREKLISAAVELLLHEGPAALTPTRLTELAGLHKPAFYAHFKDPADCLAQVVQQIGAANMDKEFAMHRAALRAEPYELAAEQRALEVTLKNALQFRTTYRLLARHRYDEGPLGAAMRENIATAVTDMTELLWEIALRIGVGAQHLRDIAALAELVCEHTLISITRVVEGRVTDIAAEAALLARSNDAIVAAEMRRMIMAQRRSERS